MAVREADGPPPPVDEQATTPEQRGPASVERVVLAIAVVGVLLLGAGIGVGLARGGGDDSAAGVDGWAGVVLEQPQDKPGIVLTDTAGQRFDLRRATAGKLTIVFFGYTNCPDVCPANLITIDKALGSMPAEVRAATSVVFVSVDPRRDTPEVIRRYLDGFDRDFVGLTGTKAELVAAQEQANVPQAAFDEPDADGAYLVGHSSQMIAYSPDGVARLTYPFGTRQVDWARDLPRLAQGQTP